MSAAQELEPEGLTARATVAAANVMEGLRFAALEEATRILAQSATVPDVGPGAVTKLVDLLKAKAASELMKAAQATTTAAIAQGRKDVAEIYRDEIALVEYSALLDDATCDACRQADGKVVKMGSAEYGRLQPPNARCRGRGRCRCVYIYVLEDEPPPPAGGPPKLAPIIPLFPEKPLLALPAPKLVPISQSPIPLKPKLPPSVTTTPTGLPPIPLGPPPRPTTVTAPAPRTPRAAKGPQVTPGYRADVAKKAAAFIARGESDDELENSFRRGQLKSQIAQTIAEVTVKNPALLKRAADARIAIYEADTKSKAAPDLRARLSDPESVRSDIQGRAADVNRVWAQTSVDAHQRAIATQIAAAEEFNLGPKAVTKLKEQVLRQGSLGKAAWEDAQKSLGQPGEKEMLKVVLRGMHENTQAEFKAKGITHVAITRGMAIDLDKLPPSVRNALGKYEPNAQLYFPKAPGPGQKQATAEGKVVMQPMSATAADVKIAKRFADYAEPKNGGVAIVMRGTVPIEAIVGTARTGMGCLHEYELVALASEGKWTIELANPYQGAVLVPPKMKL